MKNLTVALLVATLPMFASAKTPKAKAAPKNASAEAKTVALDPAASTINWVGKKVTGQHHGTVNLKAGEVELANNTIKGGNFEIDMNSIKDIDLTDEGYNKKLITHLKSDDFFGVEKYPTSTFKITSVKSLAGVKDANTQITGDLTIKGTTESISFPAQVEVNGEKATAKANLKVDRTKHNVRYGSGKFFQNLGDKMINDEFELALDLKTK